MGAKNLGDATMRIQSPAVSLHEVLVVMEMLGGGSAHSESQFSEIAVAALVFMMFRNLLVSGTRSRAGKANEPPESRLSPIPTKGVTKLASSGFIHECTTPPSACSIRSGSSGVTRSVKGGG